MTTEMPLPAAETCRIAGVEFVKPRPWPVIITVVLVGLCIGLGIWQVQRLQWKEGLIAELKTAQEQRPITAETLPQDLSALKDKNFHSVSLLGEYDYDTEYHVIGRSNSEEPGYYVLSPFRLAGEERVMLVNRGWVPQHKKDVATRSEGNVNIDNVHLSGYILVPQGGSPFLPAHDRENNIWFWQDTAAMSDAAGVEFPPFIVQQVEPNVPADAYPQAKNAFDVRLRNDHFAYSLMWFAMAFSGIVIFAIYHRKPREKAGENA